MDFEKIRKPEKQSRKSIVVRGPDELFDAIDGIAKEIGIARNKFILSTLAEAVRYFRPKKEEKK